MLRIYFGDAKNIESKDIVYNTDMYFRNTYKSEWITNDIVKLMIKDIDKSDVESENVISSQALGLITPEQLSGGVKTLILMLFDNTKVFNASSCGDNCASWILKLAENKDLTIRLGNIMDFNTEHFDREIVNNHKIVHNQLELLLEGCELI